MSELLSDSLPKHLHLNTCFPDREISPISPRFFFLFYAGRRTNPNCAGLRSHCSRLFTICRGKMTISFLTLAFASSRWLLARVSQFLIPGISSEREKKCTGGEGGGGGHEVKSVIRIAPGTDSCWLHADSQAL